MKVCSKSSVIFSLRFFRTGSSWVSVGPPPRSSSQLADHLTFMSLPVSSDLGRATGVCCCAGALVSVS